MTTPGLQFILMCITGGKGKSWASEAVIYCASALKEFYLSINRKAQKVENLSEILLFYSMTRKEIPLLGQILLEMTNSFM